MGRTGGPLATRIHGALAVTPSGAAPLDLLIDGERIEAVAPWERVPGDCMEACAVVLGRTVMVGRFAVIEGAS